MTSSHERPLILSGREAALASFSGHGGRLGQARARYLEAPTPWIDLSTGVAPWPYSIPEFGIEPWTRLPEQQAIDRLLAAARAYYKVPDSMQVVTVPGTDLAIGSIAHLVGGRAQVAVVAPTYASHAQAWHAAGHDVREVGAPGEIVDGEIGVVVNPNNPDGRSWDPTVLRALAARLERSGGFLVVDEAFADARPEHSVLAAGGSVSGTLVMRSFGKFFGLAGVRLGFVISTHKIADDIEQMAGAWPVSGPAVAIGTSAFNDGPWAEAQRRQLAQASTRLAMTLAGSGLQDAGGTPFFRLIEAQSGANLFHHLASQGILVRPFANGARLRFGLPACEADWARLTHALSTWDEGSA